MTQASDSAPDPYQTDLAQTPLPEILAKVHHYKVPGRLECRRGSEVKRIYFERGEILNADDDLWSIFTWDEGTVGFTPGRGMPHGKGIPIREAILRGVRRMPDARALLARIGTKTTMIERTKLPLDFPLAADEQALLSAADGKRTLLELVNRGNPSENARILYALFVLGLVQSKQRRPIKVKVKTRQ